MREPTRTRPAPTKRGEPGAPAGWVGLRTLVGAAVIVVVTFAAYVPALRGGFILDDRLLLTENTLIKAPDGLYRMWLTNDPIDYWPVSNSSLWLEWRLWGMNPIGYRVVNVALHVVVALLLWATLRSISVRGGFLAALLFAVHPVNVESVAWIAQRKTVLAMVFLPLSILCYLNADLPSSAPRGRSGRVAAGWYLLSLVSFVFAMLSKGSVAVLPLLLLGILWWLRPLTRRDLVRTAPFFVVSAILVLVNVGFQARAVSSGVVALSPIERVLGAGAVVWFYLSKALLPIDLSFVYPRWQIDAHDLRWWVPCVAAVLLTGVLGWYRRSWGRPLLFAWGVFCVSLAPVMGFTDVGFMIHSLVADHYQYVGLIGVLALVAAGWETWWSRAQGSASWAPIGVCVVLVGALVLLTWRQSALYVDGMTLFRAAAEQTPSSPFVHNNLGLLLIDAERLEEGRQEFEAALALRPDYPEVHYNLARTLVRLQQPAAALDHFQQALQLRSMYPEYHYEFGVALLKTDHLDQAIAELEAALRLRPDYPQAHFEAGNALQRAHSLPAAIEHFEQALRLVPDYLEAHNSLDAALREAGRAPDALAPDRPASGDNSEFFAQSNLGRGLIQAGNSQEAIAHLQQALRLRPDSARTHNDLGVALANAGQLQEAIEHLREALRLDPDDADARGNLEEVLGMQAKRAETEDHR